MRIDRFGPLLALSCALALPSGAALAECSFQRVADAERQASPMVLAQAEGNAQTGGTDATCEPGTEGCVAESGEDKQENGTGGTDGNTSSEGGGDATETDDAERADGNTSSEGGGDATESGNSDSGSDNGGSDNSSGN